MLKEHEAGLGTAALCSKHGISQATFYNWKAQFGGLEVSEAKRLKGLGDENARPTYIHLGALARQARDSRYGPRLLD